jgi:predicted deacylase
MGINWLFVSELSTSSFCFDESCILPWFNLRAAIERPERVPLGCLAFGAEMRGINSLDDKVNGRDAAGLFRFFTRRGLIAGDPGAAAIETVETVPAYEYLNAPKAGLVVYAVPLGARVKAGDLVAELIDPLAADQDRSRIALHASVPGAVISRCLARLVAPGDFVAMIVGQESPKAASDGMTTLA